MDTRYGRIDLHSGNIVVEVTNDAGEKLPNARLAQTVSQHGTGPGARVCEPKHRPLNFDSFLKNG